MTNLKTGGGRARYLLELSIGMQVLADTIYKFSFHLAERCNFLHSQLTLLTLFTLHWCPEDPAHPTCLLQLAPLQSVCHSITKKQAPPAYAKTHPKHLQPYTQQADSVGTGIPQK